MLLTVVLATVLISPSFRRAWPLLCWALVFLPWAWMLLERRWNLALEYLLWGLVSWGILLPPLLPYTVHLPGLFQLIFSMMRNLLPGFGMARLLFQSTSLSQFINALRTLKVPMFVILPTSLVLRFIPTVREERRAIGQGLVMRGWWGRRIVQAPLAWASYQLVPLLTSSARIGDELGMASLCRGLSLERPRTKWPDETRSILDWLIIGLSVLLLVLWLWALLASLDSWKEIFNARH